MKQPVKALLTALLGCVLSACGGGGDGAVSSDPNAKGVFDGYTGELYYEGAEGAGVGEGGDGDGGIGAGGSLGQFKAVEAVVFLEDGSELGRTIVNSQNGLFTIKPGADYQGAILIELHGRPGAQYYDEAKKAFVDFGPGQVLRARADRANRNIGITPLTHAAALYMDANPGAGGTSLAERIKSANKLVGTALSARLPSSYQITDVLLLPTIIGPSSGAGSAQDDAPGTYAVVLASLAEAASSFNPALSRPALSITDSLAKDLTDGRLDGVQKDGSPVAPDGQESYSPSELDGQLNSAISRSESEFGEPDNSRDSGNTNKTITLLDESLGSFRQVVEVFDDSTIDGSGPGTSTGSAVSRSDGGNPGAHLATSMNLFGGDLIAVGGIKDNYSYSPALEGALATLSAKADLQMNTSGVSSWVLAIEQGGKRYYDTRPVDFSGAWSTRSRTNLTAADFTTFGEPTVTSPDFSASGATMKFGFVIANRLAGQGITNGSGPSSLSHQIDNFELTITRQ